MSTCTKDPCLPSSRLLELPREIRDLIWEHVVVRDTIPIDCAVVAGPGYRRHTGFPCPSSPQLHKAYPLTRDVAYRGTWSLPIYDLEIDIQGGTWMEPKQVQMTYQLTSPCMRPDKANSHDKINIQLLQVCRSIHKEAKLLFYKKNVFSFTGRFPISTALAFLQDLPTTVTSLLSSIELILTEDNNMRGTAKAHFPPTTRSSDCLVLQHAFHYFTELCALLSSSITHIRTLHLTVQSLSSYGDKQPDSFSGCLAWEVERSSPEQPWIASWIQPLLHIKSLETIKVYWISDRPRVRRMSDTLAIMQRSMLKRADVVDGDDICDAQGHEIDFGILRSDCELFLTTLVFGPRAGHFEWGECTCEDRPISLENITKEAFGATRAFYKCGVATWKEHQGSFTGFKSAYTAYCELSSSCPSRTSLRRSSTCAVHLDP